MEQVKELEGWTKLDVASCERCGQLRQLYRIHRVTIPTILRMRVFGDKMTSVERAWCAECVRSS